MDETSVKLNPKEIVPDIYAQQCPVCNGFGTLRHGSKICQACQGKGYVLVPVRMDGRSNDGKPSEVG